MKKICLLALCLLAAPSMAQPEGVCRAYSIPTPGSTKACPAGYVGLQGTITTKTCPDGVITVSPLITAGCVAIEQKNAVEAAESPANSKVAEPAPNNKPTAASPAVTPLTTAECPSGQHMVIGEDGGVAHCAAIVTKLPNCNAGISDGRSLSCAAAGLAGYSGTAYRSVYKNYSNGGNCTPVETGKYNTNGCSAPIPNCNTNMENSRSVTCAQAGLAAYTGTAYTVVYTSHNGGGRCNQVAAPGYNTEECIPPVVKCTPSTVDNAPVACATVQGDGYTGTAYTTTTTTCPNGIYDAPTVTTSPFNTTACIAPPTTCSFVMNYWSATERPHYQSKKITLKIGESTTLVCDGINQNEGQRFTCQSNGTPSISHSTLAGCGIKGF